MTKNEMTTEHDPAAVQAVVEAAKAAYEFLAPFDFNWPDRTTSEGQSLLCGLLHAIVKATGCDEQEYYEKCRLPKNAALNSTTPRALTLDEARAKVEAMVPRDWVWTFDDLHRRQVAAEYESRMFHASIDGARFYADDYFASIPHALAWFERVVAERGK